MNILNYGKIDNCFVCGAIYDNIEKFISMVVKNLSIDKESYSFVHPKELERQERLKRRAEMNAMRDLRPNNPYRVEIDMPNFERFEATFPSSSGKKMRKPRESNGFNNSVIIVSGNSGIGTKTLQYYEAIFKRFNAILEKNNCHVLFVRGNHDNPTFFEEDKFNFSNIKCIKDYTVVTFKTFNCLCVGGGISIDKNWKIIQGKRLNKQLYWENEGAAFDEKALDEITKKYNISFLVTCTSPSFAYPGTNSFNRSKWVDDDKEILKSLIEERYMMDKIYNKLVMNGSKPYAWFYGKFERDNRKSLNDMIFVSLAKYEITSFNELMSDHFGINLNKKLTKNEACFDELIRSEYPRPSRMEDYLGDEHLEMMEEQEANDDVFEEPIINELQGYAVNEAVAIGAQNDNPF